MRITSELEQAILVAARRLSDISGMFDEERAVRMIRSVIEAEPEPKLSSGKSDALALDERAAPIRRPTITVHVDDTIHLEPLTELAASCLRTWGSWWKIKQAMKSGKTWLLQSVSKQPRARKAKDVQVLEIHKTEDPGYVITKVVAFPEEFNYKKHHG